MNDVPPTDAQAPSPERGIVKPVLDLQAVIEAMLSSLPASKA